MTRRQLGLTLAAYPSAHVAIPIHRIVDRKAQFPAGVLQNFWSSIWPEAVRDFAHGGIDLRTTDGPGDISHTAADRPLFAGLRRGALNLVITDRLPLYWDNSRALAGATTLDRGYCLSLIALRFAHGNHVPFFSTNTVLHEILHALLLDIFISRPSAYQSVEREYRVDWYATQFWIFHNSGAVRQSARTFLARLREIARQP